MKAILPNGITVDGTPEEIIQVLQLHKTIIKVKKVSSKERIHKICEECGVKFLCRKQTQRFCSNGCSTTFAWKTSDKMTGRKPNNSEESTPIDTNISLIPTL